MDMVPVELEENIKIQANINKVEIGSVQEVLGKANEVYLTEKSLQEKTEFEKSVAIQNNDSELKEKSVRGKTGFEQSVPMQKESKSNEKYFQETILESNLQDASKLNRQETKSVKLKNMTSNIENFPEIDSTPQSSQFNSEAGDDGSAAENVISELDKINPKKSKRKKKKKKKDKKTETKKLETESSVDSFKAFEDLSNDSNSLPNLEPNEFADKWSAEYINSIENGDSVTDKKVVHEPILSRQTKKPKPSKIPSKYLKPSIEKRGLLDAGFKSLSKFADSISKLVELLNESNADEIMAKFYSLNNIVSPGDLIEMSIDPLLDSLQKFNIFENVDDVIQKLEESKRVLEILAQKEFKSGGDNKEIEDRKATSAEGRSTDIVLFEKIGSKLKEILINEELKPKPLDKNSIQNGSIKKIQKSKLAEPSNSKLNLPNPKKDKDGFLSESDSDGYETEEDISESKLTPSEYLDQLVKIVYQLLVQAKPSESHNVDIEVDPIMALAAATGIDLRTILSMSVTEQQNFIRSIQLKYPDPFLLVVKVMEGGGPLEQQKIYELNEKIVSLERILKQNRLDESVLRNELDEIRGVNDEWRDHVYEMLGILPQEWTDDESEWVDE